MCLDREAITGEVAGVAPVSPRGSLGTGHEGIGRNHARGPCGTRGTRGAGFPRGRLAHGQRSARERFMNGEWRAESLPALAVAMGLLERLGYPQRYILGRSTFLGETYILKRGIFDRGAS